MRNVDSPNWGERKEPAVSLLVLHYTGMQSGQAALERMCDPEAQVSAHYMVEENGDIIQLVDEVNCAWHAGHSYWRGIRNVNPISIGIEIVNPGHEWGYRPFPQQQMEAVASLGLDIVTRHNIIRPNVVGHSDIAPLRKQDPGELFDWAWLAAQGVGAWPDRALAKHNTYTVQEVQHALARYGYDIIPSGVWDEQSKAVITAFQRHFRPQSVNGTWDEDCAWRLSSLLSLL